ncbi:hypothetical protein BN938_0215 [Mucinivorans hirudinis]|uniref:Lipoprotein n=1 Tax=Mucinivorans hirudinis TaxID=1433126 RepID=A0A060R5X5_9BACT|nr:hypothetical protein BN938_0215 [Mucinivorans hirudinis]
MKKTLLAIVAFAAVVVMVACGNSSAKFADKQVAIIERYTVKIDSVTNMADLQALNEAYTAEITAVGDEGKDIQIAAEDEKRITDASAAYGTKIQAVAQKFADEMAQAAAEIAEAEVVAVEEEKKK